jgi:hypothetical protein
MTDESSDETRPDTDDGGPHTGRRAFMAGAAGLAAGATLLGSGSPAGALGVTDDYPLPLKYIDQTTGDLTDVLCGSTGFAKVILSAFGDMAAASIRVKLSGTGIVAGDGPWVVDGADMPTGFEPVASPNDMTDVGTSAWGGTGQILNFENAFQNAFALGTGWINFSNLGGPSAMLVWTFPDKHNDGSGAVLLNHDGQVPYGAPLGEGTFLYSTLVYLVSWPEPV